MLSLSKHGAGRFNRLLEQGNANEQHGDHR
jgi:hypothetical protein